MPRPIQLVLPLLLAATSCPLIVRAAADIPVREFTVMTYNVEMLFDVDGVAAISDFAPSVWGPVQLDRKLAGISQVLQRLPGGRGPDVICFNELEADQTPASTVTDIDGFLREHADQTAHALLTAPTLEPGLAGLPVQAWLAKRLADDGMTGYQVVVGRWRDDPTGHLVFHTNAIFSRFPIIAARTHDTDGARGILEVELKVGDRPLHVFNNHWKSGASDPNTESTRVGNAEVLRARLDEILSADPQADVILAGDFNSQYNQKQRYPEMRRTAINDVLGSQGDESALLRLRGPELYNLWFELPNEQRGSDEWRGEWGTLMQMLVTRGLYDARGVQYIDNSFSVAAFPGLNASPDTGRPVRWTFAGGGGGYSDHLPIIARFRTGSRLQPLQLEHPSRTADGPTEAVPVRLPLENAIVLSTWEAGREFRTTENVGRYFRVAGRVSSDRPFRITVDGPGTEIMVWIRNRELREAYFARHGVGDRVHFVAELGQYRGDWQFVIPESEVE